MLRLENISKYYHTQTSVALGLKEVNLTFEKGEFVAITGESGSGKSTLLNVISGMLPYEEGEMYVEGKKTSAYDSKDWEDYRREKIGFIYQNYNLIDSYTVLENVESVMLIKEQDDENIQERAIRYLEQVGLAGKKNNRASQLSSGQKQRLSIARALAKETEILVADEPTGNLDIENGLQVMKLLHELSATKLVIVVTHNYEQVRDFATRKIRLYDGEIEEDIILRKRAEGSKEQEQPSTTKEQTSDSENQQNQRLRQNQTLQEWKRAFRFLIMNKKAQPHRNLFLFLLLFCISFAFYIFLGGFFSNMDGAMGKTYSDRAFANGDKTRLVVRKIDDGVMSEEDRERIAKVKYVQEADLYDGINDMNYYYVENEDYRLEYHTKESQSDIPDCMNVEFLQDTQYMRSATCISDSDLKEGKLPSNRNEIVISAKDKGKVGDKVKVYMRNRKNWGDAQYVCLEMTITGIAKSKKEQLYFYEDFCKTLYHSVLSDATVYNSMSEKGKKGFATDSDNGDIRDGMTKEQLEEAMSTGLVLGNVVRLNGIFICNDELQSNETRASQSFLDSATTIETNPQIIWQCKVFPRMLIHYVKADETDMEEDLVLHYNTEKITEHGSVVYEIGSELFQDIYGKDMESHQVSVYIKDYAYTNRVIEKINGLGYEAVSVYRVGATAYDYDMVYEKLQSMCISLGAFVVVFFLGIFIVYAMMKLKKDDFLTLKSLGLQQKIVAKINGLDMYGNILITTMLTITICAVLSILDVKFIWQLFQYYRWYHYLLLICFSCLFGGSIARLFNRFIKKNTR